MFKSVFRFLLVVFVLSLGGKLTAQENNFLDTPRDGLYTKMETPEREPVPYVPLREADITWKKRVWRMIDLRQKQNQPLYFPVKPKKHWKNLVTVLIDAVKSEQLTAYDAKLDDQFLVPLTPDKVEEIIVKYDTVDEYNDEGEVIGQKATRQELDPSLVKKIQIKEVWYFDKQRSVMDVRILGICPKVERYDDYGTFVGEEPLFWIYFPDAREILAKAEVFNPFNTSANLTYDDYFMKRLFDSYIYKEDNVYDRKISDYAVGMDALLESERVKNELLEFEQYLWEY